MTEQLEKLVINVAKHAYFCPEIAGSLAAEVRGSRQEGDSRPLARREREVLRLIAKGLRSQAISDELHISVSTVEVHRRNIMRKLGLHTIAELTKYAIREGIATL